VPSALVVVPFVRVLARRGFFPGLPSFRFLGFFRAYVRRALFRFVGFFVLGWQAGRSVLSRFVFLFSGGRTRLVLFSRVLSR